MPMRPSPTNSLAFAASSPTWPRPDAEEAGRVVIVTRTRSRPVLLERACQSVLAQSYRNWHLVVVNDGGYAPDVDAVLDRYDPILSQRLTRLHNPVSLGMPAASNLGLSAARGEFAVILDDDDTWHPQFLHAAVAFLNDAASAPLAGVACHARLVRERMENGRAVFEQDADLNGWMQAVRLDRVLAENCIPPCSLVMRRAAMEAVGPFNEDLTVLNDWEYLLRLLAVADIGVLEKTLAYYHQRTNLPGTPYANSQSSPLHVREQARIRNAALRRFLADPAAAPAGLLLPLGRSLYEATRAVETLRGQAADLTRLGDDLARLAEAGRVTGEAALRQAEGLAEQQAGLIRLESHLFNLAERYHVHAGKTETRLLALDETQSRQAGDADRRLAALEAHLRNLAERYHVHAGEAERRLAALDGHLRQLTERSHANADLLEKRLARLDEVHLWLSVLTWPLRILWRPLRRAAMALSGRQGRHAA